MIRTLTVFLLVSLASVSCEGAAKATSQPDIIIASDFPKSAFDVADVLAVEQAIGFAIREQPSIEGYKLGYWSLDNALGAVAKT